MAFGDKFSKLLNNTTFDEVLIDEGVIESIIYYSKESFPNEFLAFFDGQIKNNKLILDSLLFLPNDSSNTGASFNGNLIPPNQRIWGTVHSHPGHSAMPSEADLLTFRKHGVFHMILCLPYDIFTMRAYDTYGEAIEFKIGKFRNKNQDKMLEDLNQIKEELELEEDFEDLD